MAILRKYRYSWHAHLFRKPILNTSLVISQVRRRVFSLFRLTDKITAKGIQFDLIKLIIIKQHNNYDNTDFLWTKCRFVS